MDTYTDLNLVGYLYNICYGGFGFSDEFKKQYNEKYAKGDDKKLRYLDGERTDPDVVALFNELGADVSSGDFADLTIRYFPEEFLKYVDLIEYDGLERVCICKSKVYEALLKNFMEERKKNPELTLDDLEDRYTSTTTKLQRYNEYLKNVGQIN